LLFGPSGLDKSHLAAGICCSLIGLDLSARFLNRLGSWPLMKRVSTPVLT
jgi:hypothetical protein